MEESTVTASAIVSFAEKLESESSTFYRRIAERFAADCREMLLIFAEESENSRVMVTRTYRETISDALEACFSFTGLDLSNYVAEMALTDDISDLDALKMAVDLEEKTSKFYLDVSERSESLLATISHAFRKLAKTRSNRVLKLKTLLSVRASPRK